MFGLGKNDKMKRMWESIGGQLLGILAFPRHMNGGQVPTPLQNNNYVLGYHFMMCMNLYISAVQGKTNPEEQGFVLMNSLAIALGMEPAAIGKKLESLMVSPGSEFTMGTEDANAAFGLLLDGSSDAFLEFNNKLRGTY